MDERIATDSLSDLRIKFKSANTAKSVETLINSHLFTGSNKLILKYAFYFCLDVNVQNSFDPLPLYSPPIPSYEEVTSGRRASQTSK